jgi:hypothetical protein
MMGKICWILVLSELQNTHEKAQAMQNQVDEISNITN